MNVQLSEENIYVNEFAFYIINCTLALEPDNLTSIDDYTLIFLDHETFIPVPYDTPTNFQGLFPPEAENKIIAYLNVTGEGKLC